MDIYIYCGGNKYPDIRIQNHQEKLHRVWVIIFFVEQIHLVGASPETCAKIEKMLIALFKDKAGNQNTRPGGENKPRGELTCFVYTVGTNSLTGNKRKHV